MWKYKGRPYVPYVPRWAATMGEGFSGSGAKVKKSCAYNRPSHPFKAQGFLSFFEVGIYNRFYPFNIEKTLLPLLTFSMPCSRLQNKTTI